MRSLTVRIFMLACIVLAPAFASAQTSSISGVVKDDTGAVMPGVTVEAASPALIEKVRSTTSSGNGQYSILALRPGTYTVTFTLPGFQTVVRQGIELTSDFTATINVDLKVGTLEETLTVTGESPIVDTQSLTQRVVMTAEVRESLPTGRNIQAVGIMIPGTTLARRRRRRAVARRRRLGQPAAVAAAVPRLGRHRADHRRHSPQQPLRAGRLQRRLLERRELRRVQLRHRRRLGRNGPGRHARQHGAAATAATRSAARSSATTRVSRSDPTTAARRASASLARART